MHGRRPLPPMQLLRLSHPARTLPGLIETTLDHQVQISDATAIARDCKRDLEAKIAQLTGKSVARPKGGKVKLSKEERRAAWDEVKDLRKE